MGTTCVSVVRACGGVQPAWFGSLAATRAAKSHNLQLSMDEPPEALHNQWVKDRVGQLVVAQLRS